MQSRQFDISQRAIRRHIGVYLTAQAADVTAINQFKRGLCCGYIILGLIAYYLEKRAKTLNQDNWTWLMQTLHVLGSDPLHWSNLPKQLLLDVERLISLLEMFQHISFYLPRVAQGNLPAFFESTSGLTAQLEFRISGLFTLAHFLKPVSFVNQGRSRQTCLLAEILKYEYRLIVISKGGHTFGMIRDGLEINFMESNSKLLRKTRSLAAGLAFIAEYLFQIAKYQPNTPSSFGIRIFSFEGMGDYVLPSAFLAALAPPCFNQDPQYGKGYSSLHIAARTGDVVSLGYYLSKTVFVNCLTHKHYTPLYLAAAKGWGLAVDLLLLLGANQNVSSKSCIGSALSRGHHEIAASLQANRKLNLFAVKRSTSLPNIRTPSAPAAGRRGAGDEGS